MGLFGSKKTYVASTVYNMAGPEVDRISYLKSVVGAGIIGSTGFSMSEIITRCYINGPGMNCRKFHRWAKIPGNYDAIGVPKVDIYSPSYDIPTIQANIPVAAGQTATVQIVKYGTADYSYWAEQYVMQNFQTRFAEAWKSDYNPVTNTITITWPDTTTNSFNPTIDFNANYYYVAYGLKTATNYLGGFMWIYQVGSGNAAMDAMPVANPLIGEFMPFIPIRIKNQFLSSTYKPQAYEIAKKAYKKATGKKFDKLIELIADNDDIDDIDHCYMVYGVALNALDNSARKYLFEFFDFMRTAQHANDTDYTNWESSWSSYGSQATTYEQTRYQYEQEVQGGTESWGSTNDPAYTAPPPPAPGEPINEIKIRSPGPLDTKLNMVIKWNSITKETFAGIKAGHKVGDVWWDPGIFGVNRDATMGLLAALLLSTEQGQTVKINWQKSATLCETLVIKGMWHKNLIYDGKSVDIPAAIALSDSEESGFIVPIHYETLRGMSLIDSTQMMTAGTYLIFNSYEVVKQKWYQTGIFKIFIFVVMIVITVATMGATAPGLLGAAGAVGAALGFSGLMAVIVGAVANAIAAMILAQILQFVAVTAFGPKIGAIIATVAAVIATSFGSSLMSGASMTQAWGNLMSAANILGMTNSVLGGAAQYVQASVAEINQKTQELIDQYDDAMRTIKRRYIEEFGANNKFAFDPNQLTNNNPGGIIEMPQTFLDRTLLTGSEVAQMSMDMISDFATLTVQPYTMGS